MKRFFLLSSLLLAIFQVSFAQSRAYAKAIVQKLASGDFKGRGYVENGDQIAAKFIADEFVKLELEPFRSYNQVFNVPVNSFPGDIQLVIGSKELVPAQDYLVNPGSPGLSGAFSTIEVRVEDILKPGNIRRVLGNARNKIIVVQSFSRSDFTNEELRIIDDFSDFLKYDPENPAAGTIFLTNSKLIWSGSTQVFSKPSFTVLTDTTFDFSEDIIIKLENRFTENYFTQNVIGYQEGLNTDSLLVFTAHYDHLGMMGTEAVFPGANDNASGIAMLLNLAKYYQQNPPNYTVVYIAFGAEEIGLLGSKHFVENPLFPLERIKFLINFDISGTGEEGIQVVNGSVYKDQFDRLTQINEELDLMTAVKIRGAACNSDHCMFDFKNIPTFFIYTLGGIQAYHDIYDKAETLPMTKFENYFRLMVAFIDGFK